MNSVFRRIFTSFFLGLAMMLQAQFVVPKKPTVLYPIYDEVGLLNADEKENLNQKLIAFNDSTSVEILVVILPSTKGEDINYAASQIGNEWKIGKRDKDNGIVLLIATEDRQISIQQGRDVEKYLTASVSGQIIDYIIVPSFKRKSYYRGIDAGTTALMEAVQGKYKPTKKKSDEDNSELMISLLIVIVFIIIFFMKNNGGDITLSGRGTRRYFGGFGGFSGGFGSGNSGGGFGGFGGGGSFGGGGASGGW